MQTGWMVAAALVACGPAAARAPAGASACSMLGATFVARSAVPSPAVTYRLTVEPLPRGMPGDASAELWRFQTLARPGGRLVSEIRMQYSCPNGRGACSVAWPGRADTLRSDVVLLDRDFTPTRGNGTPYAILTPGFGQASWDFTTDQMASPDLTLAPGTIDAPDLSNQTVWVLSACGAARAG